MQDIVIKGKTIRRELFVLLVCIIIAFGLNIYSIIAYHTEWKELFTTFHLVLLLGLVIYLLLGLVRLLIKGLLLPFAKNRKTNS
jgi:hypothetical protein